MNANIKHEPSEYRAIYMWGKSMGSLDYYFKGEQAQASADRAPLDAVYRSSYVVEDGPDEGEEKHKWVCVSDFKPDHPFRKAYEQAMAVANPTEVLTLPDGYDRNKKRRMLKVRCMTEAEIRALQPGQSVKFISIQNEIRSAKVNGQIKTWKRDPHRLEVPLKYGMYECWRASLDWAKNFLVVEVDNV